MKLLLFPILSVIGFAPVIIAASTAEGVVFACSLPGDKHDNSISSLKADNDPKERMSSVVFKNQDYCRAELMNFEFDAHFSVISARVYFSGGNFKGVEQGAITSSSLKPIKNLMVRCLPGTTVVFDEVKVKGPDNTIRTIPGVSLLLY